MRIYWLTIYSADDQKLNNPLYFRDYNRTWRIGFVSLKQTEIKVPVWLDVQQIPTQITGRQIQIIYYSSYCCDIYRTRYLTGPRKIIEIKNLKVKTLIEPLAHYVKNIYISRFIEQNVSIIMYVFTQQNEEK